LAVCLAAVACGEAEPPGQEPTTVDPPVDPPLTTKFGGPGPWPVANARYGAADGLLETPIVAMSSDEAQNRWVATPRALYLLRPGETRFTRLDETDGLHLGAATGRAPGPIGWAKYCDMRPIADDAPCGGELIWGGAAAPGIKTIVGGGDGEVFVGYWGGETPNLPLCEGDPGPKGYDFCDPLRHSGKIDRVRLVAGGGVEVTRFDLLSNHIGYFYWHDRTMNRLAYDHFAHPGTLYSASGHGVTILFPGRYREVLPGEWFGSVYETYMGDHLHARVCRPGPCPTDVHEGEALRIGGWRGLAVDTEGRLWHAGKWTAGRITWDADPVNWFDRNGAAFDAAFGDPYLGPGRGTPPVFEVADSGHEPRMTAVAVCPDGKVWFSTEGAEDGPARDRGDVVASWDGKSFAYFTSAALGLGEPRVRDLVCLPDGRLVVAGFDTGLSVYDPAKGTSSRVRAESGLLPSDRILQLDLDRTVTPPAVNVATSAGAAVLRSLP
jgi:hypothetical protein